MRHSTAGCAFGPHLEYSLMSTPARSKDSAAQCRPGVPGLSAVGWMGGWVGRQVVRKAPGVRACLEEVPDACVLACICRRVCMGYPRGRVCMGYPRGYMLCPDYPC